MCTVLAFALGGEIERAVCVHNSAQTLHTACTCAGPAEQQPQREEMVVRLLHQRGKHSNGSPLCCAVVVVGCTSGLQLFDLKVSCGRASRHALFAFVTL